MEPCEVIEEMLDEEVACEYCLYDDECPHGMACYGGAPIEPPCASGNAESFIDYESYCEENDIELNDSEEK